MAQPVCPIHGDNLTLTETTNPQGSNISRYVCPVVICTWQSSWVDANGLAMGNRVITDASDSSLPGGGDGSGTLTCETDSITVCPPVSGFAVDDAQSNNRFEPGVRTTTAIAISSVGDNIIIAPAVGMRIRVFWIGMSTSEVGLETLAIVKFGAAGSAKYRWFLGAPGAFSHWEAIEGGTNESLIVNLSIGTTVQVNVTYEEFA